MASRGTKTECYKGHTRRPGASWCHECKKIKTAAYRAEHLDDKRYRDRLYAARQRAKRTQLERAAAADANREWREKNKSYVQSRRVESRKKNAEKLREHHLLRNYGITRAEYLRMLEAQGGRCAICRADKAGGKGEFHVDHDHVTLKIRGLLCHRCNAGLGSFRDDPSALSAALDYLEKSK